MVTTIYGKEGCPYTGAAVEEFGRKGKVNYFDVKKDASKLEAMLKHSNGARRVPVIVDEAGKVTIGFNGT
jgi:glutaredoxin